MQTWLRAWDSVLSDRGEMADEYILETEGLTNEFRGFVAVRNVNLRVRAGTIHALIGPNGAGKTTFFNLLTHFPATARGSRPLRGGHR